jgi:glycerophosphoryl diester phosphodiesterase
MVIAHRGASAYLPENTLSACAMAHSMGADCIELDLVMSSDGILLALHDLTLEETTNAREMFPDRARSDGHWYAIDFSLEEIQTLQVRDHHPHRFQPEPAGHRVPTFDEAIQLVQELNMTTGRQVGLYAELKAPDFHRRHGKAIEEALLALLEQHDCCEGRTDVAIVCEEAKSLRYLRFELGARFPLIQLIDEVATPFDAMTTPQGLDEIAAYADGIGPEKRRIEDANGVSVAENRLVRDAHARGLFVQPFTFRADEFLPASPAFEEQLERFLFSYQVDGLFTDYPDRAVRVAAAR